MSSKFKPPSTGKAQIPYCNKAPLVPVNTVTLPPGCLPPIVPAWLVAYCHWYDWDVDPGGYLSESFQLPLSGTQPKFKGDSGPTYPYLAVTVKFALWPNLWDVTLAVIRSLTVFEHHTWYDVPAQANGWIKLLPPKKITIPDYDEQEVQVYG